MYKPGEELKEKKLSKEEHLAIQAVHSGSGNEYQQRLAIKTIVGVIARVGSVPYISGSPEGTAFFSGRMYVGKLIVDCINKPYKEEPADVSKT